MRITPAMGNEEITGQIPFPVNKIGSIKTCKGFDDKQSGSTLIFVLVYFTRNLEGYDQF